MEVNYKIDRMWGGGGGSKNRSLGHTLDVKHYKKRGFDLVYFICFTLNSLNMVVFKRAFFGLDPP